MKIGDLARAGGVGVETIRFYQRRGLLNEPPRAAGARRYSPDDVRRLRSIRAAQTAGFTLDEIGCLLGLKPDDRMTARRLAQSRLEAIDTKIATLTAMRKALAELADACTTGQPGPCPIIGAFDGELRQGP